MTQEDKKKKQQQQQQDRRQDEENKLQHHALLVVDDVDDDIPTDVRSYVAPTSSVVATQTPTGKLAASSTKVMLNKKCSSSSSISAVQHEKKDLVWSNINMKLMKNKSGGSNNNNEEEEDEEQKVKLNILKGVWGKAEAGTTTAIMGASGAGKTSLFQTLAGRVPITTSSSRNNLIVDGNIYLGGKKFDPQNCDTDRKLIAYVSQDDSLHEASTPREALEFSARLRLPRRNDDDGSVVSNDDGIKTIVNEILVELGLESCADTIIGGSFKKGISGGEKRRVSIGIELISSPSLILLDEPTSGLDSYAAAQVMRLLERVAKTSHNTVLFTIHQPSSNIFQSFDRLILLSKGQVMHQGLVSEIGQDFANYGYPLPANYNPADWILDVAQGNTLDDLKASSFFGMEPNDHTATTTSSLMMMVPRMKEPSSNLLLLSQIERGDGINGGTTIIDGQQNEVPEEENKKKTYSNFVVSRFWQEFVLLQQRETRNLKRNPTSIIINVTITAILSIVFGVIFWDVGRKDRSNYSVVQSQLGAIVNLLISTLMGQSNPAMLTFSKDRPIFLREYSTGHYTIVPYFLSKLWTEALNTLASVITQALIVYWMIGLQMTFGQFLALTYSLALTATAVAVMLGAAFTDIKNALSLFTLVVVPQFYFSGLFIAIELIPKWISWAQYLCSLTYASRLGFAYEFSDCSKDGEAAIENCESVLTANNVNPNDTWWYWLALLGLFVLFRCCGIILLRYKAKY